MRVRHNKNSLEILHNATDLFIADCEKQHGKWRWFFGNNKPLHVEVGAGKGQFIIANALKYPNINFIALEKDSTILTKAVKKAEEIIKKGYPINNLKFILGDASKIEFIFDDNEVDLIYLNFSDPWPKKRQAKRRLTYDSFLKQYYQILKPQGLIELKTDNLGFFDYSLNQFQQHNEWFKILYSTYDLYQALDDEINKNNIATEYEDKFHKANVKINKIVVQSVKNY